MKAQTIYIILATLVSLLNPKWAKTQDCTINLLIVYTDEAADSLQGNQQAVNQIVQAVKRMNIAYIYSDVQNCTIFRWIVASMTYCFNFCYF